MLRWFVPARAGPLRAKPAGRPSCNRAMLSPCSSAGSRGGLPGWRVAIVALAVTLTIGARQDTAAPGPLHIIRRDVAGCIAGAVRLPAEGPGFQTIHMGRSSFWGA